MARVAALTMVYKDHWFLRKWMDYYGAHLGRENLYILSHGRDPEIEEITRGANLSVLPRSGPIPAFDRKKADLLNAFIEVLHDCYQAVIAGDVDELIAVDPAVTAAPLKAVIMARSRHRAAAINCFAWELRPTARDAPFDPTRGILQQRPHAMCMPLYCKPAISFQPIRLTPGQHGSDADPNLTPDLLLFHLRYANEAVFRVNQTERNTAAAAMQGIKGPEGQIGAQWSVDSDERVRQVMVDADAVSTDYDRLLRKSFRFMKAHVYWDTRRNHLRFPFLYSRIKQPVRLPERFMHLF